MNIEYNENIVLKECLDNIRKYLGRNVIVHAEPRGGRIPDFRLTLPTHPPVDLIGECKTNIVTRPQAMHALLQARAHAGEKARIFLCARWIPEIVAEELRREGVDFVDTVGNAYLWHPPQVLIDIRGKRPEVRQAAEPGRLVEVGGLKVCHLLLTHPEVLNQPLRVIAGKANVALATAHAVMRELMLARQLMPALGHERRFNDTKDLLETFVRGYALKLRPACLIGRYRHKKNRPDEIVGAFRERLKGMEGKWALTGGFAARQLTEYLDPETVTLFVDAQAEQRLKEEPMLPDRNGNVTLLNLFAPNVIDLDDQRDLPLATPVLIYAELLNEGGARELETAKMIYEKWIQPGVRRGQRP
jgi:hypothetical protein